MLSTPFGREFHTDLRAVDPDQLATSKCQPGGRKKQEKLPRPQNVRMLFTWLSPDDAGRLFEACLTAGRPGFRVAYGVSANTRGGWVSLAEARALGYQPEDDAEAYAAEIIAEHGEPDPDDPVLRYLGGEFTLPDDQVPRR